MASKSTLLIPILEELLVKEIGEANLPPLKWSQGSPFQYFFNINIEGKEERVEVNFQQIIDDIEKQFYFPKKYRNLNNIFNVGYDISGVEKQFAKTDLKTLLVILSTVVDIIKDFIKHRSILDGLFIKPIEKGIEAINPQKSPLYRAFIKKQLGQVSNYSYDTYRDGFILIQNKNK